MNVLIGECDCVEAAQTLEDSSIHMTLTSPPYDGIREYKKGWRLDFPSLGKELLRATSDGGVAVVVIQDGTEDGAKTGTTARLICDWMDAGWRLWETLIWRRPGTPGAWWNKRFRVDHEFVLVFMKGHRLRAFDKTHLMVPAIHAGKNVKGHTIATDGSKIPLDTVVGENKCRGTVWEVSKSNTERNKLKSQHPATFPDALAFDMIRCFTLEGDIVFDPFMGSGTTVVQALKLNRCGWGCDFNAEYVEIARARIAAETANG